MPKLRIHFTSADLTRTRLAPGADLRWETAFSLDLLRSKRTSGALGRWRVWARRQLGPWVSPLLSVAPAAERFPEFLEHLRRDENRHLAELLQRYQDRLIDPVWTPVRTAVGLDRARRTRSLLEDGLEGLLDTLAPTLSWQPAILVVDHPEEQDVYLDGRGLVLTPAGFCSGSVVRPAPDGPTVLIHPIATDLRVLISAGAAPDRRPGDLDALLGSTRAAVLQAMVAGCTTTELAQRVGISPATASQHASILRRAGLISTQRQGLSVLHNVTELGSAVLRTA